jgi:hypothetical protein
MLWTDIIIENVTLDEKTIRYNGEPLRFQIPRGYTEYGLSEHKSITVQFENNDFFQWYKCLEKHITGNIENFESNAGENTFRVKYVDGFTQVFDHESIYLMDGHHFTNCQIDILVDISSMYSPFKDFNKYGFVCKMYQVRVHENGCLFSID